ncbi:LysR family transcriptional regulator [Pseudonocardia sp. TRM90224]|uniref:LysR family transcriptional regulator n=1 Tax=Pseudonocardia sp. TRM90224 TaxID=2812678 RepID=UPI001E2EE691|nr:LysR family transcriptional regulator [Pseudonocardia sp. TRM90224]
MLDVNRLRVLSAVARTGSVTAAAQQMHYSQPSVSHHLARLEAETGAQLIQRVGRGIRLTEAGRLLAARAEEILGRLESAQSELAAHVGLSAGIVRVAGFASALLELIPPVVTQLAERHPGLELRLTETHPPEALELLRTGEVDVAIVFRYAGTPPDEGFRLTPLLDDTTCLITPKGAPDTLAEHRASGWIAGCTRLHGNLVDLCAEAGFVPRIVCTTDDIAAKQALVASGLGVGLLPQLALAAHHHPGIQVTPLPGAERHVLAATFGEPPDPPPTAAVLAALREVSERRG